MVSWVSLLMGIFSSGFVPVTSRILHSPLGGWRGCPPPHSAPPRAAGGSGLREKGGKFPATEAACKATESFPAP